MKNFRIFHLKIFTVLVVKCSVYLNRHVFVMKHAEAYGAVRGDTMSIAAWTFSVPRMTL